MAWNKRDDQPNAPETAPGAPRPVSSAPVTSTPSPSTEPRRSSERATIGPSIIIKGDLSGGEDLVIEGRVVYLKRTYRLYREEGLRCGANDVRSSTS